MESISFVNIFMIVFSIVVFGLFVWLIIAVIRWLNRH